MKKNLLNSIAVLVLALGSSVVAMADNVVYGLKTGWDVSGDAAYTTSFDIDKVNTSTPTEVASGFSSAGVSQINGGVTAGDKYFAFVIITDENFDQKTALVTFNFTTGETVVVNDFSYTYNKPGMSVTGMAYDAANDKLYAIENTYDSNFKPITPIYEVNQETGELSEVTSWSGTYQAIAANPNGGFYLLKNENSDDGYLPNLYKVSKTFGLTKDAEISNTTTNAGYAGSYSMVASEDGKYVYLVAGKLVLAFDLTAKTVALKGELSDIVHAISYGKSSANGTPNEPKTEPKEQTRFLLEKQTFGNNMGDIPSNMDSRRDFYYYNTKGKQIAYASYGRNFDHETGTRPIDEFGITDITKSVLDENGNVTNINAYQWGNYEFDENSWKYSPSSTSYAYDEDGKLIADSTSYDYYTYTYYEDGTLATKSRYVKSTNNWLQTITYENYENGYPTQYTSTGSYESYNYTGMLSYDDDGNKVDETRFVKVPDPEFAGDSIYQPTLHETWTYENNILVKHEKNNFNENGDEVPYMKTEYTLVDGNPNIIDRADSTYSDMIGKWTEGDLPQRLTYGDFTGMAEMTAMDMTAEKDPEAPNTVDIMFTVPQLAYTQGCKIVVYRDCLPIDTLDIFNEDPKVTVNEDEFGGASYLYKDYTLKNGTYTYFLQPIFTSYGEDVGPLDLDDDMGVGGDDQEAEWVSYYCSNPATVSVYTKLSPVTDVTLAGGKRVNEGSILKPQYTYYANVSWKNPENMEQYGFIKNSLYFTSAAVPEVTTDTISKADTTNVDVMLYDRDEKAYIVTKYQLGFAISDTIDIKIKDVSSLAGINGVTVNGDIKATFKSNTVSLSENANVTVFAVSGQRLFAKDNTNNVSLENLPTATYIICVEKNGKVNAYKYNVK